MNLIETLLHQLQINAPRRIYDRALEQYILLLNTVADEQSFRQFQNDLEIVAMAY